MTEVLLNELLGSANVRYYPALARRFKGAKAALLMSQLLYWNAKYKGDWFYIKVEDMQDQTGLTPEEQRTARKTIKASEAVEMKLKGVPRYWHYRVNIPKLSAFIENPDFHSSGNPINDDRETRSMLDGKPDQLNKNHKTTQETTKDSPPSSDVVYHRTLGPLFISDLDKYPADHKIKEAPITKAQAWVEYLSQATGLDYKLKRNAGRLAKIGKELESADYSPGHIWHWYTGANSWWFKEDWRGKKGQLPTAEQVVETIGKAKKYAAVEQTKSKSVEQLRQEMEAARKEVVAHG